MALFKLGDFTLHGGERSYFKIDCDALSDSDLVCVAWLLSQRLPPFGEVEGVPSGGLRLAEQMCLYSRVGPLLIVDDVLTTGKSITQHRGGRDAIGAVIFQRDHALSWVTPLFLLL